MKTLRQPDGKKGRKASCQQPAPDMWVSCLGSGSSSPRQSFTWLQLKPLSGYTRHKRPQATPTVRPTEMGRWLGIVLVLHYGVICYTTIDDWFVAIIYGVCTVSGNYATQPSVARWYYNPPKRKGGQEGLNNLVMFPWFVSCRSRTETQFVTLRPSFLVTLL